MLVVLAVAVAALVLVLASRNREPAEVGWEARARAFERGDGVARDFRAAARIYDDACVDGELAACRQLGFARITGRGVDVDLHDAALVFAEACDAGDVPSCAYTFVMPNREAWRVQIADAACRGGDLDACAAIDEVASFGCDSDECEARWGDVERRACTAGSVRMCVALLEREEAAPLATWPPPDPDPWVAYATHRLEHACDDGDVDACAALPGRALPADELCAAGDRRAC